MKTASVATQGIYEILDRSNGKRYVGSSINIESRLRDHFKTLRANRHHSSYLQHAWNIRADSFAARCIEEVACATDLIGREQFWIDHFDSYRKGYNARPRAASNRGLRWRAESRAKLSAAHRGVMPARHILEALWRGNRGARRSEESRKRMSQAMRGKGRGRSMPLEQRAKIAASLRGRPKPRTAEHQEKIDAARRGQKRGSFSAEHRARIAAAHKNRPPFSAEHRENLRQAQLRYLARQASAA